jgi:hypothetical protein
VHRQTKLLLPADAGLPGTPQIGSYLLPGIQDLVILHSFPLRDDGESILDGTKLYCQISSFVSFCPKDLPSHHNPSLNEKRRIMRKDV